MKTKFTQIIYSFIFILVMNSMYAQEDFTPGTDSAPINNYIIPMLVIGLVLSFGLLRKKNQFVK